MHLVLVSYVLLHNHHRGSAMFSITVHQARNRQRICESAGTPPSTIQSPSQPEPAIARFGWKFAQLVMTRSPFDRSCLLWSRRTPPSSRMIRVGVIGGRVSTPSTVPSKKGAGIWPPEQLGVASNVPNHPEMIILAKRLIISQPVCSQYY